MSVSVSKSKGVSKSMGVSESTNMGVSKSMSKRTSMSMSMSQREKGGFVSNEKKWCVQISKHYDVSCPLQRNQKHQMESLPGCIIRLRLPLTATGL